MKQYQSILNRVRTVEEKHGIRYAKPDGAFFRTLKIIYTVLFAYTLAMNLLFLAGEWLMYGGTDKLAQAGDTMITVGVSTVVLIAGFVLLCTRIREIGGILSIAPLPFLTFTFAHLTSDDLGFLGYKASFYWRHAVPCALMLVLLIWMTALAFRARIKTARQYERVVENLYAQYHVGIGKNGDASGISDAQWEEFLKNYDPRNYKKQFPALHAEEPEQSGTASDDAAAAEASERE